jgi:two-component system NarL family response regulator
MTKSNAVRLMIVEDNTLLRDNLRVLLDGEPRFTVVGAFGTAEEGLAAIKREPPDMLLSDLGLPGMSGVDLIREVKAQFPDVDIMAHTISEDRDTVFAALKAGASGYIIKGATPRELVEALCTLRDGGAPMSPRIARAVIREFQETSASNDSLLSRKERDVLGAVRDGLSYKEIATKLNISPHTVHSHIKNIYDKLQVKDKREALEKARRKGLI